MRKTVLMALALIVFLVLYNMYLYQLATVKCDLRIMALKNWYYIGGLLFSICLSERFKGNYYQSQFTNASWVVIFTTIIIILLTKHGYIQTHYYILGMFNLGTLIAITMITISGCRHGAFNE